MKLKSFSLPKIGLSKIGLLAVALGAALGVSGCRGPGTKNFTVNSAADAPALDAFSGVCDSDAATAGDQCTLRAAIEIVNANAVPGDPTVAAIGFDSRAVTPITLTRGELLISHAVDLTGYPGPSTAPVIAGSGVAGANQRVFNIAPGATVTLRDLTIRDGNAVGAGSAGQGSGIFNAGTLVLDGVQVLASGSAASGNGGAIFNAAQGTLTARNVTLGGVGGAGGASNPSNAGALGGGFYNEGDASLVNATLYGNTAQGNGGNIYNAASSTLRLNFCTITAGVTTGAGATGAGATGAGATGGVFNAAGGAVNISNSIVAGNSAPAGASGTNASGTDAAGAFASGGFNLIGVGSGGTGFTQGTDILNQRPGFVSGLAQNGGLVPTVALSSSSPAVDAGNSAGMNVTTDARGNFIFIFARPVDTARANAVGGDGSDIGAFEVQQPNAASFVVNTVSDAPDANVGDGVCAVGASDGSQCSLRAAIQEANANPNRSEITFNIAGTGVRTIALASALPEITAPVLIDATTQPGATLNTQPSGTIASNAAPLIQVERSAAAPVLSLASGSGGTSLDNGSQVLGLIVHNGLGPAISVASSFNVISSCFVGTDGASDLGGSPSAQADGITISGSSNLIGGSAPAARNVISANSGSGLVVSGSGNRVSGNIIGLSAGATGALGNRNGLIVNGSSNTIGSDLDGIADSDESNVIAGNSAGGVFLGGSANRVAANLIGTNSVGASGLGNGAGLSITGSGNLIGNDALGAAGLASGGNIISGNRGSGVLVFGSGNTLAQNRIGTSLDGNSALANSGDGVSIQSFNNSIGGTLGGGNQISGNTGDGVILSVPPPAGPTPRKGAKGTKGTKGKGSGGSSSGLPLGLPSGSSSAIGTRAVSADVNNTVRGNLIGVNADGTGPLGNGGNGVRIAGSSNNLLTAGSDGRDDVPNVISGNGENGVLIVDEGDTSSSNTIEKSLIGTDAAGTGGIGNANNGVQVNGGEGNLIGGANPTGGSAGARVGNVISGNGNNGVLTIGSAGLQVLGNRIGTSRAGFDVIPNGQEGFDTGSNGITVLASGVVIGTGALGTGNQISGNVNNGIAVGIGEGEGNATIQGNTIGLSESGRFLRNRGSGISVLGNNSFATIGGADEGQGNVIAGNSSDGIRISFSSGPSVIQNNSIGLRATGASESNGGNGVSIVNATGVQIGGSGAGQGNRISGNSRAGILLATVINSVTNTSGTIIQGNLIGVNALGAEQPNASGIQVQGLPQNGGANAVPVVSNLIGGSTDGAANVIAGNRGDGISLNVADSNSIKGNFIGLLANGTTARPNDGRGVGIDSGNRNTTGASQINDRGRLAGAGDDGNVIAFNAGDGVQVLEGERNLISQNSIHDNGGADPLNLGIDLLPADGVNANDGGDPDSGANALQNAPVLSSVAPDASNPSRLRAVGTLGSTPSTTFAIEFFSSPGPDASGVSEGQIYLSAINITTDASGNAPLSALLPAGVGGGDFITATATTVSGTVNGVSTIGGSTSEFSGARQVLAADLVLSATDAPDPVQVGSAFAYTIGVRNAGPDAAADVSVTLTLPVGAAFVSASGPGTGWSVLVNGRVVTATRGALAASANAPALTINATAPGTAGVITTPISVSSTTFDPTASNNSTVLSTMVQAAPTPTATPVATATATPIATATPVATATAAATSTPVPIATAVPTATPVATPVADLSVALADTPDPAVAGSNVVFTSRVSNAGPSAASNVRLSFAIPRGAAFVSADASGTRSGQALSFALGTLASGASRTVRVTVRAGAPGVLSSSAAVSATESDPNASNNTAGALTTVVSGAARADVSLSLRFGAPAVTLGAGARAFLLARVANVGPSAAPSTAVSLSLPAGLKLLYSTVPARRVGSVLTIPLGTLGIREARTFTLGFAPLSLGASTVRGEVAAAALDPAPANNRGAASVSVLARSDLSVSLASAPAMVNEGGSAVFTATVRNAGPSPEPAARLSIQIPAGATALRSSVAPSASTASTLRFDLGALSAGASRVVSFTLRLTNVIAVTTTAAVSGASPDPVAANNRASRITSVRAVADLSVALQAPANALADSEFDVVVTVRNAGPSSVAAARVQVQAPAGITFLRASRSGVAVSAQGASAALPLAAGISASFTLRARTRAVAVGGLGLGERTLGANVVAAPFDPVLANNQASAIVNVSADSVDLSISNVDSVDPVASGQLVTYTLTVTNNSNRAADAVRVTDGLGSFAQFVSAQKPRGTVSLEESGRAVRFELGALAARASVSVSVTARLSSLAGTISTTSGNVAYVSALQPDPDASNNVAEQSTVIVSAPAPAPNLVLSQGPLLATGTYLPGLFGNGALPLFGQRITVTNTGQAAYVGPLAVAFDGLPAGVQLQRPAGTTTGAAAPAGSPFVIVGLGADSALGVGESVTIEVRFGSRTRNFAPAPRLVTSAAR